MSCVNISVICSKKLRVVHKWRHAISDNFYWPINQKTKIQSPGRTEKIDNNPDPSFKTKFVVNFSFEERQWVKFEVYDWDKGEVSKAKLSDQVSIL